MESSNNLKTDIQSNTTTGSSIEYLTSLEHMYLATIVFAALSLLCLVLFIVHFEVKRARMKLITSVNLSLIGMISSLIVVFFAEAMRYRLKQRAETKYYIWQSIKLTALATQEYAYVFFSWKLAGSLLNKVYPKRYPFILVLVKLSPFILYFQAIPAIIAAIIYGHFNPYMMRLIINGAVAIAALLMLVIYFLMLVAFIKFMHRTRGAESTITETNQKFRTISRYGIISANAGVISLLLLAAYTWTNIDVLLLSAYWFVLGMFGALFYMKTKLFGIIMKVRSIQKGEKIDGCEG